MCDKKCNKWHKYSMKYSIQVEKHTKTHISIQSIQIYILKAKTGQKKDKKQVRSKPEGANAYLTVALS